MQVSHEGIYTIIITHVLGYPFFNSFALVKKDKPLSFKGKCKNYLIRLVYVVQSDTTLNFLISLLICNCLYERMLNFQTSTFSPDSARTF